MSDPPLGSDRSCIHSSSPRSIRGRCRCFSSSDPWSSNVAAIIPIDTMYPAGTRRPISPAVSKNTFWCWSVSPAPPYSFGNAMPA